MVLFGSKVSEGNRHGIVPLGMRIVNSAGPEFCESFFDSIFVPSGFNDSKIVVLQH